MDNTTHFMTLSRRFSSIAICLALIVSAAVITSCVKDSDEEGVKIVTTNISVPSPVEIEEGQTITITLRGTTNITKEDQVVLRNAAGEDKYCPIVDLKDGSYLVFAPPAEITNGSYKVYIRNGGINYYAGQMDLSVKASLNVEPGEGVTVYGIVTCDGKGVPNVLVSDGAEIVKTDAKGIYQLKSQKKWQYVFVVIPSGYEVPNDGILPKFHQILTQGANVAERKDFELIKTENDNFTLFVCGDMHLANRNNDVSQFGDVARTLNSSIASAGGKTYVMTLGDMTWDNYWYSNKYEFPQYLQTVNTNFKDVTFFHTMGNHDNDMTQVGDFDKSFRYTRDIAPTFYSFNLGKIHFVVMDNIDYNNVAANTLNSSGSTTGTDHRGEYVLDYTAEQMQWLVKDLSYVDKSTPVFITSHAPVSRPNGATSFNDKYMNGANSAGEANMQAFISTVKDYNVNFLSGHTHNLFHRKHNDKFSEHNEGAICACWWWTGKITPGIHVSQDGTPGGFAVWQFTGKNFKQYFQAAGHDANYQFRAYDVNKVKETYTTAAAKVMSENTKHTNPLINAVNALPSNSILVNVWNWDPDWKVSISENGKELTVSKAYTYDPLHAMAYTFPRCASSTSVSFPTGQWSHFFTATASSASSTVTVTVTDGNGKTYTETMTRPKAFTVNEYKNK